MSATTHVSLNLESPTGLQLDLTNLDPMLYSPPARLY